MAGFTAGDHAGDLAGGAFGFEGWEFEGDFAGNFMFWFEPNIAITMGAFLGFTEIAKSPGMAAAEAFVDGEVAAGRHSQ